MKKPNFFIIGAPKCGTTSLSLWLSEHPNIYMSPVKELMFYCRDINKSHITGRAEYEAYFKEARNQHTAVGEASASYLYSQEAVPGIEKDYPGSKYIIMLRNPVEMAYSLYDQHFFRGDEHISDFRIAWHLSPERRQANMARRWCSRPRLLDYQLVCSVGSQLERLFRVVSYKRTLVLLLDNVKINPRREYLKALSFLNVPDDGRKEFPVKNPAKKRKSHILHEGTIAAEKVSRCIKQKFGVSVYRGTGILKKISILNTHNRKRSPLPEDLRREMAAYFKDDIEKLGQLLSRDLSSWVNIGR